MPVQSIDLSAVTGATFDGSAVDAINLNGAEVWSKGIDLSSPLLAIKMPGESTFTTPNNTAVLIGPTVGYATHGKLSVANVNGELILGIAHISTSTMIGYSIGAVGIPEGSTILNNSVHYGVTLVNGGCFGGPWSNDPTTVSQTFFPLAKVTGSGLVALDDPNHSFNYSYDCGYGVICDYAIRFKSVVRSDNIFVAFNYSSSYTNAGPLIPNIDSAIASESDYGAWCLNLAYSTSTGFGTTFWTDGVSLDCDGNGFNIAGSI